MFVGPIGNDTVHHKCANRRCCNPNRLQRATQQENKAEMFACNGFEAEMRRLTRENRDLRKSLMRLQNTHPKWWSRQYRTVTHSRRVSRLRV